ncbi:hypothetical protein C8R44DRAFT_783503 [Mycena epipterygia]|nr:hypothetical protein C8R44DRAFT_783503 [Mycena epipterygia]
MRFYFCASHPYFAGECTRKRSREISALPRSWDDTFEYQANHALDDEERIFKYQFSPDVQQGVIARDNQRCRFTGLTTDSALCWIFPPIFKEQTKTSWFNLLDKYFVSPPNVLTMHPDLAFHFHSNNFGVDVDDDYRIVVLRDIGNTMSLLPTHLPRHPAHDATADAFLRDHFKFSIATLLLRGDIGETYGPPHINQVMEELGFDPDDGDLIPLSDEAGRRNSGRRYSSG